MKTLIIHPRDASTDFLTPIYENILDKTVIRSGGDVSSIIDEINKHDRVLMMGHGSPGGLFSVGNFSAGTYVISDWTTEVLQEKNNNVFIWCNADKFVDRHRLKGFYSGMFISEVVEALYCGLRGVTQDMIDESNNAFSQILGTFINGVSDDIYRQVKDAYGKLIAHNPVARYNHKRLYIS